MPATIKSYNKRLEALKSERSSFQPWWQELADYHVGHRGRFLTSDRNKGYKRNTKQYNNSSRLALRTLSSGMMSGITSPARPWFKLGTTDPRVREVKSVSQWLHRVQQIMYQVFAQSNTYNSLHSLYSELGAFGTGAMGAYDDFENVIRCHTYTIGSYYLALNGVNEVDTFYREYDISVAQCIKQFGKENCSPSVQDLWKKGSTESWITIIHVVEPNDDRDMTSPKAKDLNFRSVYYEKGTNTEKENKFLRESGFKNFPIMAPRWDVVSEDVYAVDCPGMTALGDTKALQLGEKKMYTGIDMTVNPPMQGPVSMKPKVGTSLRPGELVWHSTTGEKIESIYNINPNLGAMQAINQEATGRISRAFYEDLFLMLANSDRRQITAREVAEKHEEKLLMLGPVLERLHSELLDPLINITFEKLQRHGVLPPPPKELEGTELSTTYISVLAQAQRMVATSSIDGITGFVGNLAQIWPEARHKFDADQAIDEYSEALGVPPSVIRSDDEVAAIKAQEAQAQAQAQAMQQGQELADVAKTMSETPMEGDNALAKTLDRAGLQ